MKTRFFKLIAAMALLFTAIPIHSQNYLKIWFKDGHTERHYMHLVESISTTKYDLKGNLHEDYQMQQIVMADTTYSYYLADIDSMSFKKVYEEQLKKEVEATINTLTPIYEQCPTIEDLEKRLDEIKNVDGVENAYSTGTDIVVQVKDWHNIVYNYFLRQEEPLVGHYAKELASRLKGETNPVNSSNTTKPKVAIVFQQVDDLSQEWGFDLMIDLKENLKRKGFDVRIIANEEKGDEKLDAGFYLTRMFQYDLVLLETHGLSLGGKHALYTGESANAWWGTFLTIENYARQDLDEYGIAGCNVGTERLSDGTYKTKLKYYWYVSEDLIKKSSAKFKDPGTHIIFIGACEQLKGKEKNMTFDDGQKEYYGDSFAQVLFNKGADFVVGYTKKALRSTNASNNFYRNMLNGFSLEASLEYLPNIQKKEITVVPDEESKGARLIGLYNPDADDNNLKNYFLFKTKTEQLSEQELAETYKSGNAIVSGTTTAEYPINKGGDPMESSLLLSPKEKGYGGTPIKLRCGFRHGVDPNLSENYQEVYCENPIIEEKTIDNVHFSCNISVPPVCSTYYYRAFTYDGLHYNYGDICYFTLKEPFNPDQDVTQAQYEAAKAGIEVDGTYHIYTQFNGTTEGSKKYYLKDNGSLTDSEEEAYVFTFGRVEGSSLFVSPGWKLDIPFSNPHLSNGATGTLPLHGQIRVDWENNRNDWEGQVWYKSGDYCAVRSTNAVSEQWGANTYWTVLDSDANGMPEADYSLTPKFVWQLEKAEVKEEPRDLMLTTESDGTTYSIYRQVIDKKDIHTNPDKWITYRSLLTLDVTKNGMTTTYTLDDNIYLEERFAYNEGQYPCIILNYQTNEIGIFCVSKDANAKDYTMDGYCYTSPMNSISFKRVKVFGNDNWGWYPYFTYNSGQLKLQHFSFHGYYAMTSTRSSSGSWSTSRGSYTKPENFKNRSLQIGNVLVIN